MSIPISLIYFLSLLNGNNCLINFWNVGLKVQIFWKQFANFITVGQQLLFHIPPLKASEFIEGIFILEALKVKRNKRLIFLPLLELTSIFVKPLCWKFVAAKKTMRLQSNMGGPLPDSVGTRNYHSVSFSSTTLGVWGWSHSRGFCVFFEVLPCFRCISLPNDPIPAFLPLFLVLPRISDPWLKYLCILPMHKQPLFGNVLSCGVVSSIVGRQLFCLLIIGGRLSRRW